MASYLKWVRRHTVFHDTISNRDREIACFCIAHIIRDYQRHNSKFYFKDLEAIHVGKAPTFYSDMVVGLTTATKIHTTWSGIAVALPAETRLVAHELAHFYFLKLLEGISGRDKDWKNLPHYADNVGKPYLKEINTTYRSFWQRYLRRPGQQVRIVMLDIQKLLTDRNRIIGEIKAGLAPQGQHRYFPQY